MSQDCVRGRAKHENTCNLYTYFANDPINYVDPSGHWGIFSWAKLTFKKAVSYVKTIYKTIIHTAVIAAVQIGVDVALTAAIGESY